MKIIESTRDKTKITIYSVNIKVIYNVYGTLLELTKGTEETSIFKLSLLDVETDNKEGATSIEFSDFKDLDIILKDFKNKFNNSKK